MVISAGLAPTGFNDGVNAINDRLFLNGLYAAGIAEISDAIGAHPGGWANPPDAVCCNPSVGVSTHFEDRSFYFLDTLTDYRQIMEQNNDGNTPIWVTKFGWGTSEDTVTPSSTNIFLTYTSLGEQAIYVPRGFELGSELGFVGPMFLYNLNGCETDETSSESCYYSLIGPSGMPRPVYAAVQNLPKLLAAATPVPTTPIAEENATSVPAVTQEIVTPDFITPAVDLSLATELPPVLTFVPEAPSVATTPEVVAP